MQNRKIVLTNDGSHTVYDPQIKSHFHSIHGAITESNHVFIKHGLEFILDSRPILKIFEFGFGTGLNAYLSYLHSKKYPITIHYDSVEAIPLDYELVKALNYPEILTNNNLDPDFISLHTSKWNQVNAISTNFLFHKINCSLDTFSSEQRYDLIYFDAFDPVCQPHLWDLATFEKLYGMMVSNSILVTYCAKGVVRRNLKEVGFKIESLPGPPGKREMTRAIRL